MRCTPSVWLNRVTVATYSISLGFVFCGLFLVPEGKALLSNLLVISIVLGLINFLVGKRSVLRLPVHHLLWVFLGYGLFILVNRFIHGDQYGVMRSLVYVVLFGFFMPREKIILTVTRHAIQIGGISLGLLSMWQVYHGITRVEGFTNAILFSQAALALALLNWFIGYERANMRWDKLVSLIAIIMSLYALYASQSRGVWLALILILPIMLFIRTKKRPLKYAFIISGLFLGLIFFYQQSSILQGRINASLHDIQKAEVGTYQTSWGLRLVAWQGAWQGFLSSPVIGVGTEGFDAIKKQLVEEGKSSPLLLHPALAHSHNQYMQNLMIRGAFGFIALLLLMGLPSWWGGRIGGISSVLAMYPIIFAVYGLSDVPFEHQAIVYLYTLGLLFLWLDRTAQDQLDHMQ
ncbi:O-antigen ligase family protein [Aeromonas cavernicola]|uniref:Polymerase n=1 Tax=Aeromonas cavernicola TaxID=1006623 RepID=A0A2H9U8D1_9GAMM|nr:O-antigen ligase family protein [Aeromonas cavernicola]PJG60297.1 polymerase [Aeromonas cavernicola]